VRTFCEKQRLEESLATPPLTFGFALLIYAIAQPHSWLLKQRILFNRLEEFFAELQPASLFVFRNPSTELFSLRLLDYLHDPLAFHVIPNRRKGAVRNLLLSDERYAQESNRNYSFTWSQGFSCFLREPSCPLWWMPFPFD
jgi:hypothetical protein